MKDVNAYMIEMMDASREDKEAIGDLGLHFYEEFKKTVPAGADIRDCIKEARKQAKAEIERLAKEREAQEKVAAERCRKKKEELLEKYMALEAEQKAIVEGREPTMRDLAAVQALNNLSTCVIKLQYYKPGDSLKFKQGDIDLEIDPVTENEELGKVFDSLRDAMAADQRLDFVEKTQAYYDRAKEARKSALDGLNERRNKVNGWNGWQRFWAKVLPVSWYSKAEEYQDLKNYEKAMDELNITEEGLIAATAEAPKEEQPAAGVPLSDEKQKELKEAVEAGENVPSQDLQSVQQQENTAEIEHVNG